LIDNFDFRFQVAKFSLFHWLSTLSSVCASRASLWLVQNNIIYFSWRLAISSSFIAQSWFCPRGWWLPLYLGTYYTTIYYRTSYIITPPSYYINHTSKWWCDVSYVGQSHNHSLFAH
jgi:hypothetical protein